MRLTVVIDLDDDDDQEVRRRAAMHLRLLSSGRDQLSELNVKEGYVTDLQGDNVGHWKIDP